MPRRSIRVTPMPRFSSSAFAVSPARSTCASSGLVEVDAEHEVDAPLEVEPEIDGPLRGRAYRYQTDDGGR